MKLNTIGPNQNEITMPNGTVVFFSYNTPVAARVERFQKEGRLGRRFKRHRAVGLQRHCAENSRFEAGVAGGRDVGVLGLDHAYEPGPLVERGARHPVELLEVQLPDRPLAKAISTRI